MADQDGAIDVVILGNATLRVLYNEQTPFCNRASATCRDFESMCAPYAWNGFADSLSVRAIFFFGPTGSNTVNVGARRDAALDAPAWPAGQL